MSVTHGNRKGRVNSRLNRLQLAVPEQMATLEDDILGEALVMCS